MRQASRVELALLMGLAALGTSVGLYGIGAGSVAASEKLTGAELVRALQQGGYVIYLRHGATLRDQQDADRIDLERCETQRNLSDEGRRQARETGAAFTALRIRVGRVLTSPFCRAVDTAKLAFGVYEKSDALSYALRLPPEERREMGARLRGLLATPPAPGTNTILVSHHANLKEAVGLWPKDEGDAHIFRPRGKDGFEHVTEVPAAEWAAWARAMGATR